MRFEGFLPAIKREPHGTNRAGELSYIFVGNSLLWVSSSPPNIDRSNQALRNLIKPHIWRETAA